MKKSIPLTRLFNDHTSKRYEKLLALHKKMKFSIKDFFSKCDQISDLVTFTEEILNGKLHFWNSVVRKCGDLVGKSFLRFLFRVFVKKICPRMSLQVRVQEFLRKGEIS